jgi:hypothetical protein
MNEPQAMTFGTSLALEQKSFIVSRQWSDDQKREVYAGERLPMDN